MPRTKIDIPETTRTKLVTILNRQLANLLDLKLQLKQAHWNVKGGNFIGVHLLFDDVAKALDEYSDLVAERVAQLGGFAEGTLQTLSAATALEPYPTNISDSRRHVDAVSSAIAHTGKGIREAIAKTDELGDADAADIFTEVSRGLDKWLWFVEAHNE